MLRTTLFVLLIAFTGCAEKAEQGLIPPLDPPEALQTMELIDGFEIELFASEPLIADPVAMEIDEAGRIYVVEMPGYPLDTEGSGRIRLLSDTNGDGYPDRSTLFAEGLVLPKGIMRWKRGVLVTDAPDILYLEDTNGDGKADSSSVLLTGFARSNPQHNVNKPLYGLDNWIYLANRGTIHTETYADKFGDPGSEVRFADRENSPTLPVNAAARNVRFRPDSLQLELLSSSSQFGHDFDERGRHFLISNAHHLYMEAIAARYLDRNPLLRPPAAVHYLPLHGNAAEVFPITRNPEHQLLTDIGVMTSAGGLILYTGGEFGPDYEQVAFLTESVHNLVHADRIRNRGALYESERLVEDVEFLASEDPWFRPVNITVGPDGALYIIDYYRHIIEHPQWMDDETLSRVDLYAGSDRGRIYRVTATGAAPPDWLGKTGLEHAGPDELIALLGHRNLWWRRHAQRLLVDRGERGLADPLRELIREETGHARLHALWTLEGLGILDSESIRLSLSDMDEGIRENAILLAERHMVRAPELLTDLLQMEEDRSNRVTYQLLLTLGFHDDPDVSALRDRLLFRYLDDYWMQIAALSSPHLDPDALLLRMTTQRDGPLTEAHRGLLRLLGGMVASGSDPAAIIALVDSAIESGPDCCEWQPEVLEGIAGRLRVEPPETGFEPEQIERWIDRFFDSRDSRLRSSLLRMIEAAGKPVPSRYTEKAAAVAGDPDREESFRNDALQLIRLGSDPGAYRERMLDLVSPDQPASIQQSALGILALVPGGRIGEELLARWELLTPSIRSEAVGVMMNDESRTLMLLDAVEEGVVPVSSIGWNRRVTLMRDREGIVRERARELLREEPRSRLALIDEYEEALVLDGDRDRGRSVYAEHCSACHQIGGRSGTAFGPDIGTVRHWTPRALMTKVLDPNRSISDGFQLWLVRDRSGESFSGVLSEENARSITLRSPDGSERIILRSDIDSIQASGLSVMPEGMEEHIGPQEMADLIEFIRRGGDGRRPVHSPPETR